MGIQQLMLGVGASKKTYVDELFNTQLWTGDAGTNRSFDNGINLSGEGGMVWFKRRNSSGGNHTIYDTTRAATKAIYPNSHDFGDTLTNGLKSFNSNGFTVGNHGNHNTSNNPYVAYSFRKAPGFFDVVTWTGNQTANRKISHSLGSVPGAIWIKRLGGSTGTNVSDWVCYNRGSDSEQYPQNFLQFLNRNVAASNDGAGNYLYNVAPTADEFTIGSHFTVNASGNDYIAYVFAHNDAKFGEGGNQSIIKCGYYSGNDSSNGTVVNLGWEPQWILNKRNNNAEDWMLFDTMRGIRSNLYDLDFRINDASAEADIRDWIDVNSTGFQLKSPWGHVNASGSRYTYIAIRRPDGYVGKPADAGTDVFAMDKGNGNTTEAFTSGFPVDFALIKETSGNSHWEACARLIDGQYLQPNTSAAMSASSPFSFDSNTGWLSGGSAYNTDYQSWMWKRGQSFDCVVYKGNGSANHQITHGLSKVPQMMWIRRTDSAENWEVYHYKLNGGVDAEDYRLRLDRNLAQEDGGDNRWNAPTATHFTVNTDNGTNNSSGTYLAMLFTSVDGISKLDGYSGSSSNISIDLGFQPRFLIVRRYDDSNSWATIDTERGWTATEEKQLFINQDWGSAGFGTTSAVQRTSTGFTIDSTNSSQFNNGSTSAKYIYYAHA